MMEKEWESLEREQNPKKRLLRPLAVWEAARRLIDRELESLLAAGAVECR